MARSVVKTLIGISAGLVLAGLVPAQDPFAEGVTAYWLGDKTQALAKFQEALASNPGNEQAFDWWRNTDAAVWNALLLEEGEIQKIAQHLLDVARAGRREQSRDAGAIAELVDAATSGDYPQRRQAALKLAAEHGEFAVAGMLGKLGDADDDMGQINAINVLYEIGRPATLALVEALGHDNHLVRRNAIAALSRIRDERAVGALAVIADRDANEAIRAAATAALRSMGHAGAAGMDVHLKDAKRFLSSSGVRQGDRSEVIWTLTDGALVATDVLAAVYNFELAKKSAHAALALDPSSDAARVLVARAYLGQAAAINASARSGEDSMTSRVPSLNMVASAMGLRVVRRAVTESIGDGMVSTAVAGIEMLGAIENRDDLAGSPLVANVGNADARIANASAIALTRAAAGGAIPSAGAVVNTLAKAVQLETLRNIKVIDGSPMGRKAIAEAGFKRGFNPGAADTATTAMNDLYAFPDVDVVVINEVLPDAVPEAIIGLIKKDARMQHVKILIIANDTDAATERFGDRIDGTIKGPLSGENLRTAVESALEGVEVDARRARADEIAVRASGALLGLAKSRVDVGAALDSLVETLQRGDAVAVPAAMAIGYGGSAGQIAGLVGAISSDSASLDLKVVCADALGSIFARSGAIGDDNFGALMAVVKSDADDRLRGAVVAALGKASLDGDAQMQLINALRTGPGAGAGSVDG